MAQPLDLIVLTQRQSGPLVQTLHLASPVTGTTQNAPLSFQQEQS